MIQYQQNYFNFYIQTQKKLKTSYVFSRTVEQLKTVQSLFFIFTISVRNIEKHVIFFNCHVNFDYVLVCTAKKLVIIVCFPPLDQPSIYYSCLN